MSEGQDSKRWWQTVPAILGGLATLVGAITGLLIALGQIGVFQSEQTEVATPPKHEVGKKEIKGKERTAIGFRVVEVYLRADPFNHVGQCPVKIEFSGRISVAGGSGTVSYKFLRSDGALGPVKSIHFDGPGSKRVTTTWTLGGANPRFQPYSGWQAIKIFDPKETESKKATFKIYCQ